MWAFALAVLMAVLNGVIFPIFSIFLSKMLATLIKFLDDKEQARKDANMYALIYVFLAIAAFVVNFFQMVLFSYVGEEITKKIRI
jgi:ABC-type Mn2+/Zn2+ transport system permease subunit